MSLLGDKYEPLPPEVYLAESEIHGFGIFAQDIIPLGTFIGIAHVKTKLSFQHGLIRTPLGGFINHSEKPNCKLESSFFDEWNTLVTIKDIMPDEELTLAYSLYDPT
tara:strand:+ start:1496 stop:1816 length:321 start_codon:yes stop_codon:yes gene_type:complete